MLDTVFRRILRNAPQYREATLDRSIDRHQVPRLHVRQDARTGRRKGHEVSADVAFHSQGEIEERLTTTNTRP